MNNLEKRTISGPHNIVRLEGKISKNQKVLYIFFDVDNIKTFLTKEFKKSTNTLDFFLETNPSFIFQKSITRGKYLRELRQLVAQAFTYNLEENKVYESKIFPQVRLHYIDIRDYLFDDIMYDQIEYIQYLVTNIYIIIH